VYPDITRIGELLVAAGLELYVIALLAVDEEAVDQIIFIVRQSEIGYGAYKILIEKHIVIIIYVHFLIRITHQLRYV
jgi:hypothetical protein